MPNETTAETGSVNHASSADAVTDVIEPALNEIASDQENADNKVNELREIIDAHHVEVMTCIERVSEKVETALDAMATMSAPIAVPASVVEAVAQETPIVVAEAEPVNPPAPEKSRRTFSKILRHK